MLTVALVQSKASIKQLQRTALSAPQMNNGVNMAIDFWNCTKTWL
jgi:hypothetical protein